MKLWTQFISILSKIIITTVMIVQSLSVAYDNKRALCWIRFSMESTFDISLTLSGFTNRTLSNRATNSHHGCLPEYQRKVSRCGDQRTHTKGAVLTAWAITNIDGSTSSRLCFSTKEQNSNYKNRSRSNAYSNRRWKQHILHSLHRHQGTRSDCNYSHVSHKLMGCFVR